MARKKTIKEEVVEATAPVVLPGSSFKELDNIINNLDKRIPIMSNRFSASLGDMYPFYILEINSSEDTVEVVLGDCPDTRVILAKFISSLAKKKNFWNDKTDIHLLVKHLDESGVAIAQTEYKNLCRNPIIQISCHDYDILDVSRIILSFQYKTLELR